MGYTWKATEGVNGFATTLVAEHSPAAGTRLVDTVAPMITLRLDRNVKYAEEGVPENFAPFGGTRVLRPGAAKPPVAKPSARPKKSPPAAKRPKAVAKKP